jgi:hypothetical protein
MAKENPMKDVDYHECFLCGEKAVAPNNFDPLSYPKHGVCPACTKKPDFEEQMNRYKERKGLRDVNTTSS